MAMRWKKKPRPTGLAGVGCGAQGSTLRIDGETRVATTNHSRTAPKGWFWVAGWQVEGLPHKNTCSEPLPTEAEAKAAAFAYVRAHLRKK